MMGKKRLQILFLMTCGSKQPPFDYNVCSVMERQRVYLLYINLLFYCHYHERGTLDCVAEDLENVSRRVDLPVSED